MLAITSRPKPAAAARMSGYDRGSVQISVSRPERAACAYPMVIERDVGADQGNRPRGDLPVPANEPVLPDRALQPGQPGDQHDHDQQQVGAAEPGEPAAAVGRPPGAASEPRVSPSSTAARTAPKPRPARAAHRSTKRGRGGGRSPAPPGMRRRGGGPGAWRGSSRYFPACGAALEHRHGRGPDGHGDGEDPCFVTPWPSQPARCCGGQQQHGGDGAGDQRGDVHRQPHPAFRRGTRAGRVRGRRQSSAISPGTRRTWAAAWMARVGSQTRKLMTCNLIRRAGRGR